ncbi:TetR/AcrR family transcriptional regulator [Rhodococcus sp. NPDC056960]|uniref:TetR/AcrR family transcriptional regulator n=1 Tax=Rhodococcus sp. NPDC056960 TaxID=3345982 RepID=UPI0036311E94
MAPKSRSIMSAPATRPRRGTRRRSEPGETSSQRRQALLNIAADLFAEQGFRSTTVRQIGDAAGVLSGSLYHHFDSKEAIVDEILSEYFTSLMATYESIVEKADEPSVTLRNLVKAAFNSLDEHRAAITVIQNERGYLNQFPRFAYVADAEAEVRRIWTKVLDDGIASGAFRDDMDTTITYRFLRDSLWVAVRWFTPSGRLSADELADQYLKLVMSGLEKPDPWAANPDRPLFSG